jgi:hypothetical protein
MKPALARTAACLLSLVACGIGAQQPLPPPVLTPFADNQQWMLVKDFIYVMGSTRVAITVPKGFVTDFASIPQAFWTLGFSPNGKYSRAAIVHDFLYWSQGCTRLEADNILLIAMKESAVPPTTRDAIYQGVRLGGGSAWDTNAAARARGLPRVVPKDSMDFGPLDLWRAIKGGWRKVAPWIRPSRAIQPTARSVPRPTCLPLRRRPHPALNRKLSAFARVKRQPHRVLDAEGALAPSRPPLEVSPPQRRVRCHRSIAPGGARCVGDRRRRSGRRRVNKPLAALPPSRLSEIAFHTAPESLRVCSSVSWVARLS